MPPQVFAHYKSTQTQSKKPKQSEPPQQTASPYVHVPLSTLSPLELFRKLNANVYSRLFKEEKASAIESILSINTPSAPIPSSRKILFHEYTWKASDFTPYLDRTHPTDRRVLQRIKRGETVTELKCILPIVEEDPDQFETLKEEYIHFEITHARLEIEGDHYCRRPLSFFFSRNALSQASQLPHATLPIISTEIVSVRALEEKQGRGVELNPYREAFEQKIPFQRESDRADFDEFGLFFRSKNSEWYQE